MSREGVESVEPRMPRTVGFSRSFRMVMKNIEYLETRWRMNLAFIICCGGQEG